MRRRPWILIVLALLHIVAPFFNLIFDALWAQIPIDRYLSLFFMPHNFSKHWFHFLAPMAAGLMIYLCRRWSYLIYVSLMVALGFVSYASYMTRWDLTSPLPLILAYALHIGIVTYFLFPAVRNVYFDPRLRWWESRPRYQTQIDCLFTVGAQKFQGVVCNFSQTGLFLKADILPDDHGITRIEFTYEELPCQFQGQVVHHGKISTKGFGVRFLHTPKSRKNAKTLTEKLQASGLALGHRDDKGEDTFQWWLRRLVKTGQGLMPKVSSAPTSSTSSKSETKS